MARLILIVVAAFKVWMFIDAVRRHADTKWFYIIMFVPGGGVIYFVSEKLRDPGLKMMGRRLWESLERPPSVEELERRFKRTPSLENRISLGQGLFDAGQIDQAKKRFEEVLEERPNEKAGLHGLGVCLLELGDPEGAREPLQRVVDEQPGYRDYELWPDLAEALWQNKEREEAVALLGELVRHAPRLRHVVLQARYLARANDKRQAAAVLEQALGDDRDASSHVRRQNRPWARQARRMLAEL